MGKEKQCIIITKTAVVGYLASLNYARMEAFELLRRSTRSNLKSMEDMAGNR